MLPAREDAFFAILAALLLAVMAVLAGGSALRESVTIDEVAHIGAGVSYLQKLDLRMNEEHPPLPKILAALPLVIRGTHADYSHVSWTFAGEKFFGAYLGQWIFGDWILYRWNDAVSTVALARLPMLLLTLALGWSVFALGKLLGGNWGGLLCLVVFVSSPVFLAFGPLVHTDIPVTLFSLLALWTFARVWTEPDRKSSIVFGICLACAILSKFTAGILFFAFGIFALTTRWWPVHGQPLTKPDQRVWRRLRWRATWRGIGLASVIVYIFYFIFSLGQSTDSLYFVGHSPGWAPLRRMLMPAWIFVRGLFMVIITGSRPTFILGHSYSHGVWFYYPIIFVLKSPLAFLGLLLLGLGIAFFHKRVFGKIERVISENFLVHWRVLWISLIVFAAVCMLSRLDISIRHFTVPIMLIIMLLAPVPRLIERLRQRAPLGFRLSAAFAVVLAGACLVNALRTYPFYFPYINSLSFGRPNYALMNDSNLDWNQSIPEARKFAQQHGLQKLALDWYGLTDSTLDVPGAYQWNCQEPSADDGGRWAVVSATLILDSRNCSWLLSFPHESIAGGSMLAVHLPQTIPAAGAPTGPPLPSQYRHFFGMPFDIRGMFLDLNQNPEKVSATYAQMSEKFKQQMEAQKRAKEAKP